MIHDSSATTMGQPLLASWCVYIVCVLYNHINQNQSKLMSASFKASFKFILYVLGKFHPFDDRWCMHLGNKVINTFLFSVLTLSFLQLRVYTFHNI